jgi:hypothetical protein
MQEQAKASHAHSHYVVGGQRFPESNRRHAPTRNRRAAGTLTIPIAARASAALNSLALGDRAGLAWLAP